MRKVLFRITLAVSLAACALSLSGSPFGPRLAQSASPVLDASQQLYDGAKFNDAIKQLRDALSSGGVTGADALKAKELLGRCLVKLGNRVEAKEQFKNLLRQDGGYRLDTTTVPPDEMEVFELASKEILAEQIQAGQRIPASLSLYWGKGPGDNKDLGDIQALFGGPNKLDVQSEFGGSVRFPLHPRWSLDLELSHLRSTGKDTTAAPNEIKFEASAIPLIVSVYYALVPGEKYRANVFVGAGRLFAANEAIDIPFLGSTRIKISDTRTGSYFHVGAEGEYLVVPKLALTGRVLYRGATAKNMYHDSTLQFDSTHPIKNLELDFSGVEFAIGLRAYIGY